LAEKKQVTLVDAERIWAPWRIGYVAGELAPTEPLQEPKCWQPGADSSCFLCRASATYDDAVAAGRQNLVVRRDSCVVTLLNRFPYANGHLLVAPTRDVADLDALRPDEHLEAMNALGQFAKQIKKQLK